MAYEFGAQSNPQNYGLHQDLSSTFGYTGEFGGGQWGDWASANLTDAQRAQASQMDTDWQSRQTDWGRNPELAQNLARRTGYEGDWGSGGFSNYMQGQADPYRQQIGGYVDEWHDPSIDWGRNPELNQLLSQTFGYGDQGTYSGDYRHGGWTDYYNTALTPQQQAEADAMIQQYHAGMPPVQGGLPEWAMQAYQDALGATRQGMNMDPGNLRDTDFSQYMDPYQQMVIDEQMKEMQRSQDINQMRVSDAAEAANAYGGDRHGVATAEQTRNFQDQQQRWLANLMSGNWRQAQEGAKFDIGTEYQDIQNQFQGGKQLGALSGIGMDMGLAMQGMTGAAGQQQYGIQNQLIGNAYKEYLISMGMPAQQAQLLSSTLPGASNQGSTADRDAQMTALVLKLLS